MHSGFQEREDSLHHLRSTPGVTGREHVGAEQEHGPNHILGKRLPNPTRVRQQKIELQLVELIARDPDLGELAEAGVDAVDHLAGSQNVLHDPARLGDSRTRLRVKRDPGTVASHGLDPLDIEGAAVDHHLIRHAHALNPQQVDR